MTHWYALHRRGAPDSRHLDDARDYEVSLLRDRSWSPSVDGVELAPTCDECGNSVTTEGVNA